VLGLLLFVIFINDLPETVNSDAYLFADDTKIFKIIKSSDDSTILKEDLTKLEEWSDTWLLRFHPDKWKHMHIGQKNDDNSYSLHRKSLEKVIEEKDIGVVIDSDLTFEKHINEKVSKANQMFATLRSVTCRGLHVTGVIRFVPELLLWIQVTLCISCF
jgi:hypothetical protein